MDCVLHYEGLIHSQLVSTMSNCMGPCYIAQSSLAVLYGHFFDPGVTTPGLDLIIDFVHWGLAGYHFTIHF